MCIDSIYCYFNSSSPTSVTTLTSYVLDVLTFTDGKGLKEVV